MIKLIFRRATYWTSGSEDSNVTKGGANFFVKFPTKSASLAIISMYFMRTFTALNTTAALAWANLGVILSHMDCASRSSLG